MPVDDEPIRTRIIGLNRRSVPVLGNGMRTGRHQAAKMSYILNCEPSAGVDGDWTFEDAVAAGVVAGGAARAEVDLRRPDWPVRDQGSTGACVGFAAADGVLHWHYREAGLLAPGERPSPRFIWMANKETDRITDFPTTFIESAGTQTKRALRVARRYGCVPDSLLPMDGRLSPLRAAAFYTLAARYRIASYHNLRRNRAAWRRWLANQGPILARVVVDRTFRQATATGGELARFQPDNDGGGHAICLVGYTADAFIVRNSWGAEWGDAGFAYASEQYAAEAITEAYGAVL